MWALASFGLGFYDQPWMQGIITGLKLLAVVVVIDACTGMYQSFCRETSHAAIALVSAVAYSNERADVAGSRLDCSGSGGQGRPIE